jgi:hypothetical protein|tara:strand:+ start:94 stop:630 length:537 start_codon:yes stop_codon:yes gene_type:complete
MIQELILIRWNNEQASGEPYTKTENSEKKCSRDISSVHQEGQLSTSEDEIREETNESSQDNTFLSEHETNTENQISNEVTRNVQGGLDDALEYIKKKRVTKASKVDQTMRRTIIDLLKRSTQGKDLIADNVLRELGIDCRGAKRKKLKNKILRNVKDMKDNGTIEEYRTDTRKRLRLL